MTRRVWIAAAALAAFSAGLAAQPEQKPKLVVGVVIDQFRQDYLMRYRPLYKGGFARIYREGAVYTNAFYEHIPTVTAIGHATFLTGALPSASGIVGNDWYDRDEKQKVTSVSDAKTALLGVAPGREGASPRRLRVSTVGDELKMAGRAPAKVIGVSLKDRAAILPAGHMADAAYWFDTTTGNVVSSTFYFAALPAWVEKFNAGRPSDRWGGAEWRAVDAPAVLRTMPAVADAKKYYDALAASPWGNEVVEELAELTVTEERMGQGVGTDLLTVSFSSNDYVGHAYGPDSPQVRDMCLRTDALLAKFFNFLDAKVGKGKWVLALTGDHGVGPIPEVQQKRRMPGGRLAGGVAEQTVQKALDLAYGEGQWIGLATETGIYLNEETLKTKKLAAGGVERTAVEALRALPYVARAYGREELAQGLARTDATGLRAANGFDYRRSPNLMVVPHPFWVPGKSGTTHFSPYNYDSHVPVVLMGPGITPGVYHRRVGPRDIAPTLAAYLEVETPSGAASGPLLEALGGK